MKNPRKLTRRQKILLSQIGYEPKAYAIARELENTLILVRKATGERLVVEK